MPASSLISYVRGAAACDCIVTSLPGVEADLRAAGFIAKDLSGYISQGAYNATVAASANTHRGGGVWDLQNRLGASDREQFCRTLANRGWRAQYRTTAQGFSAAHYHVVVAGCPHLDDTYRSAAWQESEIRAGRNGLQGRGPDWPEGMPWVTWQEGLDTHAPGMTARAEHTPVLVAPMIYTLEDDMADKTIFADDGTIAVLGTGSLLFQTTKEYDCYLACLNSTQAQPVQAEVLQVTLRVLARTKDYIDDLNRGAGERALGLS